MLSVLPSQNREGEIDTPNERRLFVGLWVSRISATAIWVGVASIATSVVALAGVTPRWFFPWFRGGAGSVELFLACVAAGALLLGVGLSLRLIWSRR